MSVEKELAAFDKAFNDAEVKGGAKGDLPEGDYNVTVSAVEIFKSKDERLFFKLVLMVMDGDMGGATVNKIYSLDNPERLGFLKSDLMTCGLHLKKFSELPKKMTDIEGVCLKVHAKKKGQYTNYYINGKLSPEAEDVSGEDVPF